MTVPQSAAASDRGESPTEELPRDWLEPWRGGTSGGSIAPPRSLWSVHCSPLSEPSSSTTSTDPWSVALKVVVP